MIFWGKCFDKEFKSAKNVLGRVWGGGGAVGGRI